MSFPLPFSSPSVSHTPHTHPICQQVSKCNDSLTYPSTPTTLDHTPSLSHGLLQLFLVWPLCFYPCSLSIHSQHSWRSDPSKTQGRSYLSCDWSPSREAQVLAMDKLVMGSLWPFWPHVLSTFSLVLQIPPSYVISSLSLIQCLCICCSLLLRESSLRHFHGLFLCPSHLYSKATLSALQYHHHFLSFHAFSL